MPAKVVACVPAKPTCTGVDTADWGNLDFWPPKRAFSSKDCLCAIKFSTFLNMGVPMSICSSAFSSILTCSVIPAIVGMVFCAILKTSFNSPLAKVPPAPALFCGPV